MKNVVIVGQNNALDELFLKVGRFSSEPELMSHWARYLCVLVYGFIEVSVKEICFEYATARSSPEIANFVKARIKGGWNWNFEEVSSTIARFDPNLRIKLEALLDQEHKDALNSVVGNRHAIAHGISVSLSFSSLEEYYGKVVKVIEILESVMNP